MSSPGTAKWVAGSFLHRDCSNVLGRRHALSFEEPVVFAQGIAMFDARLLHYFVTTLSQL